MIQTIRRFALACMAVFALVATAACDRFPDTFRTPITGGNKTPVLVSLSDGSVNRLTGASRFVPAASAAVSQPAVSRASASLAMVEVFPGYFCPENAIDSTSKKRIWGEKKAGTHPYANTPEKAVNGFRGLPQQVKAEVLKKIKAEDFAIRSFAEGEVFCEMWWSSDTKDYRMNAGRVGGWVKESNADTRYRAYTVEYQGFEWVVKDPSICNNWDYVALKKQPTVQEKTLAPGVDAPKAAAVQRTTAPTSQTSKIENPFNLYVFAVVKETIPSDLLSQIDAAIARESDETAGETDGAVSRDFGARLWDLSVEKKTVKMVPEEVSLKVSHPGNGNTWAAAKAVPSTRFPGRTYFWTEIPRSSAAEKNSLFEAKDLASSSCTPHYPNPKMKPLKSFVNAKPDAGSELAQMAKDTTKTGFRMWAIMSCPSFK